MSTYKQRDIVLTPFPFSDQSATKVRPVLILSNDLYNRQSADILVCGLTSNLKAAPYSIYIDLIDVEQVGSLRQPARIKVDAIASLDQTLIIKSIARLKQPVFARVIAEITKLLK